MSSAKIEKLKKEVYELNQALKSSGLIQLTWGNASIVDRELKILVIKPSGVQYDVMTYEDMVVVDLLTKETINSKYKASSDLETHLYLYEHFKDINSVIHTHSKHAVMWAQALRSIPIYGTTHADVFSTDIPCTRMLTNEEITSNYEGNTGAVIVESFRDIQYQSTPGVIVAGHGPFTWGKTGVEALENSISLEEVSEMALGTEKLNPAIRKLNQTLVKKHHDRKHGEYAYYGQK